jgi:Tol biopolymer transport system component
MRLSTRLLAGSVFLIGLAAAVGEATPTWLISYIASTGSTFDEYHDTLYVRDTRAGISANVFQQRQIVTLAWSPDGTRITLSGNTGEIFVWDRRDAAVRAIAQLDVPASIMDWSPDGQSILISLFVYHQDGDGDNYDQNLYRLDANGGDPIQLTFLDGAEVYFADWSPDGGFIVFSADFQNDSEIYRIDPGGANLQQLTDTSGNNLSPVISPDGERIAFISGRDKNGELYVMNADGSGQRRLTSTAVSEYNPAWSPDGSRLLMATTDYGAVRSIRVQVMNADGTGLRRLRTRQNYLPRCWLPDGEHILYEIADYQEGAIFSIGADGQDNHRLLRIANRADTLRADCAP